MSRIQLLKTWRERLSGYARAFARRPSKCANADRLPRMIDERATRRELSSAEQRVRRMFRVWDEREPLCEKALVRFFNR